MEGMIVMKYLFETQIGIMQGRLTRPKGRGIQFFPFENWENEFIRGKEVGIKEIEFIFDYDDYEKNPLWNDVEKIKNVINQTGIQVNAVCFDYFMRRPFYKYNDEEKKIILEENKNILETILNNMKKLEIGLIEIPLVDDSSLKTEKEALEFRDFLLSVVRETDEEIKFGLETDLPPYEFKQYIDSFENDRVGANYDIGNSSGLGYAPYEEITVLGNRIFNIHIKDRLYKGTTVKLGTGSADFDKFFKAINEIGYSGNFILQAARGEEGQEEENIRIQIEFLKGYMEW